MSKDLGYGSGMRADMLTAIEGIRIVYKTRSGGHFILADKIIDNGLLTATDPTLNMSLLQPCRMLDIQYRQVDRDADRKR